MLKPIRKPNDLSDIPLPVFVNRPKPLPTHNTNKLWRKICSSHHSLGRRLDPLNWQQEIHSLCHPPVLLSLVVVLQPLLLGEVHVAAIATVFSVWSKNCGFLSAQATLKKEGRGGSCGLSNHWLSNWVSISTYMSSNNILLTPVFILTWQMPQTSSRCSLSFSFNLVIAFWCPSSMLQVGSITFTLSRMIKWKSKTGSKPRSLPTFKGWPQFLDQNNLHG